MNLRIFFDPVSADELPEIYEPYAWMHSININNGNFPELHSAKIALVGLTENRGTFNKKIEEGPTKIRKKLYQMSVGMSGNLKIVDLGNLRNGLTLMETCERLKEVVEILLQKNIFPIILGGGHDLDYGQFLGYQFLGSSVNMVNIDAYLDMNPSEFFGENRHHINKILQHQHPSIFHYAQLGYQTYLNNQEDIKELEKRHFELYRLGNLHENLEEIEPVIRSADLLSFDITAVKSSYAPGNNYALPFGLTGEQACQICWYAGLSNRLKSAGFYEYNPQKDHNEQTAFVIATMIWYLVEGIANQSSSTIPSEHYIKYLVSISNQHQLTFYKDKRDEKWWMEVAVERDKEEIYIVPCSYSDYQNANKGELPNRWIINYSKLI